MRLAAKNRQFFHLVLYYYVMKSVNFELYPNFELYTIALGPVIIEVRELPCISRDNIWGGGQQENGGNPPKTNFLQVLDHLPGFKN